MPDSPATISDQELVQYCLQNKRAYQEILYRRFADRMYNVALYYATEEGEAADILQEGFIQVFRKLKDYRYNGSLEGWIRKIVVRKALDFYRKKKRKEEVLEAHGSALHQKIDDVLEKFKADELIRLVNSLPTKAAMVLKLYAIEGYAHKEIAEIMAISEGTSKSQLNRARALLKEKMAKSNGR